MEQARNYVCKQCSTNVPSGHKFCGSCGALAPAGVENPEAKYFGTMQAPGRARLILIRGDQGVDGLSYLLQGTEHIAGRQEAQILFPEDHLLSRKHANFVYRGDKLVVVDENSVNGIYVRIRQPTQLQAGDHFMCGEQVFQVEALPKEAAWQAPDKTYFYASPKRPATFRIVQMLQGGVAGMVHCARANAVQIGRENGDMNFPGDPYMSASHATVETSSGGTFLLTDKGSKNGTYTRVKRERELAQGDYLFLGAQLLRVEMTA